LQLNSQRPHRTSGVSRFRLPIGLPTARFPKVSRHAGLEWFSENNGVGNP
jgi:hypothetical protein